jgi:hypothetical protein
MKQSSKQKANSIFSLLAIAILAIGTYLTLSHSAIATKINIWQSSIMGGRKYFPVLTIFILSLLPLLLLAVIKKVIKK